MEKWLWASEIKENTRKQYIKKTEHIRDYQQYYTKKSVMVKTIKSV